MVTYSEIGIFGKWFLGEFCFLGNIEIGGICVNRCVLVLGRGVLIDLVGF